MKRGVARWLGIFGLACMLLAMLAASAQAQGRRVALVIGNNAYASEAVLYNAVRDAELVADAFQKLGFQVTLRRNLDNRSLRTELQRFERMADGADVAAIYFAGHGVAVDGRNWLLPVDTKLESARDLDDEAVPHTRLVSAVEGARGLQLVILDACRNNPYARRLTGQSGGRTVAERGLQPIPDDDQQPNRLIAFSARDGQVAKDGPPGSNGPFAVSLSQRLVQPGVEIGLLFRRVHDDVVAATRSMPPAQEPWTYGNLSARELYLSMPTVPPPAVASDRDTLFWQSAEHGGTAADYDAYLRAFPDGAFAALAHNRLALLRPIPVPQPPPPADPGGKPKPTEPSSAKPASAALPSSLPGGTPQPIGPLTSIKPTPTAPLPNAHMTPQEISAKATTLVEQGESFTQVYRCGSARKYLKELDTLIYDNNVNINFSQSKHTAFERKMQEVFSELYEKVAACDAMTSPEREKICEDKASATQFTSGQSRSEFIHKCGLDLTKTNQDFVMTQSSTSVTSGTVQCLLTSGEERQISRASCLSQLGIIEP